MKPLNLRHTHVYMLWVSGLAVPPEPVCLGMNVQVERIRRLESFDLKAKLSRGYALDT